MDFPGHVIGHFSNDLIKYLEEKGEREVFVEIEIISDIFGEVIGHSESDIAGYDGNASAFLIFWSNWRSTGFTFRINFLRILPLVNQCHEE